MTTAPDRATIRNRALDVIAWASIWGIFEATVGYFVHLIPINIGWLIWYPVACFFMANVYRKTGSATSIIAAGALCAAIKMLNLLPPGRIDRVINPAVSILFEALAMAAVVAVLRRHAVNRGPLAKAVAVLAMGTCWRLAYILYLLFLVPDWMREISVISDVNLLVPFLVTQNLATCLILFIGYQYQRMIFRPFAAAERGVAAVLSRVPGRAAPIVRVSAVAVMLCLFAVLEYAL